MAQFASDLFAGADGTELTAYSANWTRHTSYTINCEIATGRVRNSAASVSAYWHSGAPATADYSVSADLFFHEVDGGIAFTGIIGRVDTAANTFYMARYDGDTTDAWRLFKFVAGAATQLGASAQTIAAGSSVNVKLEMVGSAIKLYKAGEAVALISVTDTAITAAGKSGLRVGSSQTNTTGIHVDNFSANDAGGAALVGSANGQSSTSEILTTAIPLAGASLSVTTATGQIITGIPLAAAAAAISAANGSLTASINLNGAAVAQAAAAAGLDSAIRLSGASGAQAAASGDLTIQIRLQGAALAQAVASGGLSAGGGISGAATATAGASGAMTTGIPVLGAALSVSGAAGALTTAIPLGATAAAIAQASANLATDIRLSGVAASITSAVGSLDTAITLSGNAVAQALVGGDLTATITLSGAAVAQAAAYGALALGGVYQRPPAARLVRVWPEARRPRVLAESRRLVA